MIKFYRGERENFNAIEHSEGIYFTTDTTEILTGEENSYGKNADASTTTEDIIVAGGPLANEVTDNWPTEWVKDGNKVIPAGTSIQSIFQGLLLKTVNGTVSWGSKTWNPSLGTPTVTLSSNGPAEIGSTVTCTVTSNSNVSGNKRSATCTASQGHFTSLDGSYVSGNKTVSVDGTTFGSVTLAYTWNGTALTGFTSGSTTLKIASGTNTFVANQSGITVSVAALPETTVYASTNTKQILENVKATLTDTKPTDKQLTSTKNDTIVGSYKYFYGSTSGTGLDITSELVRDLSNNGFVSQLSTNNVENLVLVPAGSYTYIIAVPEGYGITNILTLNKDAKSAWSNNGQPKTTINVKLPDNNEKMYNIFYCENLGDADAEFTDLKLGAI